MPYVKQTGRRYTNADFVHATEPIGWFVFRNLKTPIEPSIITPVYNKRSRMAASIRFRDKICTDWAINKEKWFVKETK